MIDKVLCPWCGAEMTIKARWHYDYAERERKVWNACAECYNDDCGVNGPYVIEYPTEEEAIAEALNRALRRYEPPIRPLTLWEARNADYCYFESNTKGTSTQVVLLGMDKAVGRDIYVELLEFGEDVEYCEYANLEGYGKTWRCWPRKPTDEEREACEWENA